jgi:hypothetical protein
MRFLHPGYKDEHVLFLQVPALHRWHGIHHRTALEVCAIVAGNAGTATSRRHEPSESYVNPMDIRAVSQYHQVHPYGHYKTATAEFEAGRDKPVSSSLEER